MKIKIFTSILLLILIVTTTSCTDENEVLDDPLNRAELFVTSNANGTISVYDFSDISTIETTTLTTSSSDNEGIHYNPIADELFVASRSNFNLNIYTGVENQIDGLTGAATGEITGSADFDSPRDIAVRGNIIVVSDSGDSTLYLYTRTASGIELRNEFDINFPIWGIEFVGNDLYAVVDQSGDLAIFTNFLNNTANGNLTESKRITIEGIVRTQGITYEATSDVLVLTDIGSSSSDSDGGLHIIAGAISKISAVASGGSLAIIGNQVKLAGSNTLLGNPVDVDYDPATETIYVAEKANGGGRILGFDAIASGNVSPIINYLYAGASSIDFYREN
jgi:hypothetical protein